MGKCTVPKLVESTFKGLLLRKGPGIITKHLNSESIALSFTPSEIPKPCFPGDLGSYAWPPWGPPWDSSSEATLVLISFDKCLLSINACTTVLGAGDIKIIIRSGKQVAHNLVHKWIHGYLSTEERALQGFPGLLHRSGPHFCSVQTRAARSFTREAMSMDKSKQVPFVLYFLPSFTHPSSFAWIPWIEEPGSHRLPGVSHKESDLTEVTQHTHFFTVSPSSLCFLDFLSSCPPALLLVTCRPFQGLSQVLILWAYMSC